MLGSYICGLVSYTLCMDMYVFWDDDVMWYASIYARSEERRVGKEVLMPV